MLPFTCTIQLHISSVVMVLDLASFIAGVSLSGWLCVSGGSDSSFSLALQLLVSDYDPGYLFCVIHGL